MAKVSFDFDGTLEREEIQEYAKELVEAGHEVWIVTTRYDNEFAKTVNWKMKASDSDTVDYPTFVKESNDKLLAIADEVGIPRDQIHFTNMEWKYSFLKDGDFDLHLDDNPKDLNLINKFAKGTAAIGCKGTSTWRHKCDKALNNIEDETSGSNEDN